MRGAIITIILLGAQLATAQPSLAPQRLTPEEEQLLDEGLINGDQIVGGVLLSATVGFGAGQAVEGRWGNTGYLFAIGDGLWTAGLIAIVANHGQVCGGLSTHCNGWDQLVPFDLLLMVAVRTLEIVDASVGPGKHNRRVRTVRSKIGQDLDDARIIPFVTPIANDGGIAGVALHF